MDERQSKVSKEGKRVEECVISMLCDLRKKYAWSHIVIGKGPTTVPADGYMILRDACGDEVENIFIPIEKLAIYYHQWLEVPDADIVVYSLCSKEILLVISVKKSFRERGAQTAYWGFKLRCDGKPFKYILVTIDNDKELFDPKNPGKKRKWRKILPHETDGVFVIDCDMKNDERIYKDVKFFVGNAYFRKFVKSVVDMDNGLHACK